MPYTFSNPQKKLSMSEFFLKHRRVQLRNVSEMWDKKVWTENRHWRPPLSLKILATRNFLKPSGVTLEDFLVIWNYKSLTNIVIIFPPPPHLIHNLFRSQCFSETQKASPTNFFGAMRHQKFDILFPKIFQYQKFPGAQTSSSIIYFGTVR